MSKRKGTMKKDTIQSKSVLELSAIDARAFFLKTESYCRDDLPPYFDFTEIISNVDAALIGKKLSDLSKKASDFENVNYIIHVNKDHNYAWRPYELIHPALYVSLIHIITTPDAWDQIQKRFKVFGSNKRLQCRSIPVQSLSVDSDKAMQINQWWLEIEQRSIEFALEYEYLVETDITDCYGSIYTHSISWALHTKETAKITRDKNALLGNIIDASIQDMHNGQTNGVPQGSVLMDFVAEMVLGYADSLLSAKLADRNIKKYHILRYRDDYRIFVHDPQIGLDILKALTEVMIELGLKLNPSKTKVSHEIIRDSIKKDKRSWMQRNHHLANLQKQLTVLHEHAIEFPNSGSLVVALSEFNQRLSAGTKFHAADPFISIITDIAYRNSRTYPLCVAILSRLISKIDGHTTKKTIIKKIKTRFKKIPNTGHLEIWLQRMTYPIDNTIEYAEPLTAIVRGQDKTIWNNDWITSSKLKNIIKPEKMILRDKLNELQPIVESKEVELFTKKYSREFYK